MFANPRRQSFMTEVSNDHPQLQSTKTATQLNSIIRSAANLCLLGGAQIFRHQRKGAAQKIHVTAVEHRKIKGSEQPFRRIEHERVRALTTFEYVTHLGNERRRTSKSRGD